MPWFLVWTLCVLAALGLFVHAGLFLWRRAKVLLAQAKESGVVLERLQDRVEELKRLRGPDPVFTPDLAATPEQRQAWRDVRAAHKAAKQERKDARTERTVARWRRLGLPM